MSLKLLWKLQGIDPVSYTHLDVYKRQDLPRHAVVETNCLIEEGEIRPLSPGPLPGAVRGLVQQVKAYEQLTIEAAVKGDERTAYLALLNHPLVGGADRARALLDQILKESAPYLPQFG